jgi:hypothetical protein
MRDFDKKLDKLSAIVATMAPSTASQPTMPLGATLPSQISDSIQRTPPPASTSAPPTAASTVPQVSPLAADTSSSESSLVFWEAVNDSLSSFGRLDPVIRSISLDHMQVLLGNYRNMVDSFPFIPLPRDCCCRDLVSQRPMLMLAVLTVASFESVTLQATLSREFRKVLMIKIMNGEKSLDLLQGLLIFIAWHHHYMDSHAISVLMLLQISVGIARDLGLDNISASSRSSLQHEGPRNMEAKRAYLGCYYLASNIGLVEPGKPRCLSYSGTLRAYASELASAWEHKSDAVLPILIDICQYMEDVEQTFYGHIEQALVARSQVKRLSDKWDRLRSASKLQATDFSKPASSVSGQYDNCNAETLQWMQFAARIHLYKTAAAIELADRDITPWASGFQLSLRVTSLRSIEQFLDNGMTLPTSKYEFISLVDWLNLVSGITSLSKLALASSPLPGWDPVELQIAQSFEYFRDQLSAQMPRRRDATESNEDVFERFRRVTAVMKLVLRNAPGRSSPSSGTFELATGSGRTVSLLQDLALPKLNGKNSGTRPEQLPSLRSVHPSLDLNNHQFHWNFLMGTV